MHHFHYVGQSLACESVDLAEVAQLYGTPTYVYSATTLAENYTRLANALTPLDVQVCYAAKANSNLAILRQFANLGAGFDIVSGGELKRVLAAGSDLRKTVFAGVGKTEAEIKLALQAGVFALHVESEPELARINHVAGKLGLKAPAGIRLNPDVDAQTHAKITTGKEQNKFGIPLRLAGAFFEAAAKLPHIALKGVQMHIGSQITSLEPFVEAVTRLADTTADLKMRFDLSYISLGGGIGIVYRDALASGRPAWWLTAPESEKPFTPEAFGEALIPLLAPLGMKVLIEPGRFLVGNAGVLLSRVEYLKRSAGKNFLIIDAAMNDLIRPAMYDGYHEIVPLRRDSSRPSLQVDVVGPICESSDCFAQGRSMQQLGEGEHVALMSAGAYGFSMASRYNSRPMPAEVVVKGSTFELVTPRESLESLFAAEKIPAFLR